MKFRVAALLLLAMTQSVFAANQFTYQGQPIHPECITRLIDDSDKTVTISLKACRGNYKARNESGYITTQDENNPKQQESSQYSVIGNQGNRYLIDTGSWTGGSGFFTSIIWVELRNDQLTLLKALAGGDRCNGGTSKAGNWEYSINETPYDMLSRAGSEPRVKAYDEIEASAASCVARSIYRFNPDTATSSFISMKLNDEALPMDDYIKEIKYQACFNRIYNEWIEHGKRTLTQNEIIQFRQQFDKTCLK